ncbi:DUF5798 family protein [Halocatena salina]|uniref:DUF5798 family protein n=1 Tax=Halocatena salina TaxID=2934340 RepID=A0A8U0A256_9EURY|nr:DUF5798 family protein [Halocatena salina]UPM43152.1 DUF5798 family protein [Halocatena salina]
MGLGGTAKKLQQIANMAEEMYARVNDLREQLNGLSQTVEQTDTTVEQLRREHAETRALVEQLAEKQGIDIDDVRTDTNEPREPRQSEQPHRGHPPDEHDRGRRGGRGTAPGSSSVDRPPGNQEG